MIEIRKDLMQQLLEISIKEDKTVKDLVNQAVYEFVQNRSSDDEDFSGIDSQEIELTVEDFDFAKQLHL